MKKFITFLKNLLIFIIVLFSFILIFTIDWLYKTFGNLTLEEIVFQLNVPFTGSNTDYYYDYAQKALPLIIICTVISFIIICMFFKRKKIKGVHFTENTSLIVYKKFRIDTKFLGKLAVSILVLIGSIIYANNKTDFTGYLEKQYSNSPLIEEEYINAANTEIEFPENKRNLIYIYLESMEATYYSKENDGAYDESIIPELEQLAANNISFSKSNELAGLYVLPGTAWTVGAMTAQTTGLPLKIPIEGNSYGQYNSFMPGAYSIGQILQKQGYRQMLMIGSDARFAGRDSLFKQHGGYEIFDVYSAVEEEKIKEENFVWWGFPDRNLFEYAKEKIITLASGEQPFNFTMLTVDTHPIGGYFCEDCEEKYDDQYLNVLACSSKKVNEFIEWIQMQDFYENTTIIVCGDHLSMQPQTFEQIDNSGYKRTAFNVIINSPIETENTKNRYASTIDMFPTTLASLGAKIKGERLGLGTNLFSKTKTIIERLGLDYVDEELCKNSKFYNEEFLYEKK